MLLRKSDFPSGFTAKRTSGDGDSSPGDLQCPGVKSEDVEPTGVATSPNFSRGPFFVLSNGTVFGTRPDAEAVWRDFDSRAGRACFAKIVGKAFEGRSVTLVSVRRVAFPRVGQRSLAYRLVAKFRTVPVYLDWIMAKHSRAAIMIMAGGAFTPVPRSELVRLARISAGRMAAQMRT